MSYFDKVLDVVGVDAAAGKALAADPSPVSPTGADAAPEVPDSGWQFNRKICGMRFSLKNHSSFVLRFPTLRTSSKMVSLDMPQKQNGISSRAGPIHDSNSRLPHKITLFDES